MGTDDEDFDEYIYDDWEDCNEEDGGDYVDSEKILKEVSDYLKEEHPAIFADMILKDIIK